MQSGQLENKTISNKGLIGRDRCSVLLKPEGQPGTGRALQGPALSLTTLTFPLNVSDAYLTLKHLESANINITEVINH